MRYNVVAIGFFIGCSLPSANGARSPEMSSVFTKLQQMLEETIQVRQGEKNSCDQNKSAQQSLIAAKEESIRNCQGSINETARHAFDLNHSVTSRTMAKQQTQTALQTTDQQCQQNMTAIEQDIQQCTSNKVWYDTTVQAYTTQCNGNPNAVIMDGATEVSCQDYLNGKLIPGQQEAHAKLTAANQTKQAIFQNCQTIITNLQYTITTLTEFIQTEQAYLQQNRTANAQLQQQLVTLNQDDVRLKNELAARVASCADKDQKLQEGERQLSELCAGFQSVLGAATTTTSINWAATTMTTFAAPGVTQFQPALPTTTAAPVLFRAEKVTAEKDADMDLDDVEASIKDLDDNDSDNGTILADIDKPLDADLDVDVDAAVSAAQLRRTAQRLVVHPVKL